MEQMGSSRFAGFPAALILSLSIWAFSIAAGAAETADSDGKRLVDEACTQCHGLYPIVTTRDGGPGWRDTVQKMVVIGAQLNRAEIDQAVKYLATQYGPGAGPMTSGRLPSDSALELEPGATSGDIVLPPGKGKELVQGYCQMCHGLGLVVIDRRSEEDWRRYTQNMLAQAGLEVTADDVSSIVSYLTEHFGSDPH